MNTWRLWVYPPSIEAKQSDIERTEEVFEFPEDAIPLTVLYDLLSRRWRIASYWNPRFDGSTIYLVWDMSGENAAQLRREPY